MADGRRGKKVVVFCASSLCGVWKKSGARVKVIDRLDSDMAIYILRRYRERALAVVFDIPRLCATFTSPLKVLEVAKEIYGKNLVVILPMGTRYIEEVQAMGIRVITSETVDDVNPCAVIASFI
jgi:hypothetical protein